MLNRYKVIIAVGIAILLTIIFIASVLSETWFSSETIAIHIVIDNRTNKEIGPFVVSEYRDSAPLKITQIKSLSKVDVYYLKSKSGGENEIIMADSNGNILLFLILSKIKEGAWIFVLNVHLLMVFLEKKENWSLGTFRLNGVLGDRPLARRLIISLYASISVQNDKLQLRKSSYNLISADTQLTSR